MDWDDAPRALHEELLPKRSADDTSVSGEAVRIHEGAAADACDDDAEAPAKHLREVAVRVLVDARMCGVAEAVLTQ